MEQELESFVREERYIVAKRSHMTPEQESRLRELLSEFDLPPLQCAVVESDWPEYEPVWQMVEARVTGNTRTTQAPLIAAMREGVEALDAYTKMQVGAHDKALSALITMRDTLAKIEGGEG